MRDDKVGERGPIPLIVQAKVGERGRPSTPLRTRSGRPQNTATPYLDGGAPTTSSTRPEYRKEIGHLNRTSGSLPLVAVSLARVRDDKVGERGPIPLIVQAKVGERGRPSTPLRNSIRAAAKQSDPVPRRRRPHHLVHPTRISQEIGHLNRTSGSLPLVAVSLARVRDDKVGERGPIPLIVQAESRGARETKHALAELDQGGRKTERPRTSTAAPPPPRPPDRFAKKKSATSTEPAAHSLSWR